MMTFNDLTTAVDTVVYNESILPFIKNKKEKEELVESTSFKTDFLDTNVVGVPSVFCFGAAPVTKIQQVMFAAGGKKQSALCGFKFTSKINKEHPNFQIVYVPKLQSKHYQKKTAQQSLWQAWQIEGNNILIMSIEKLQQEYGFDILQFAETDLFKAACNKFKTTVAKGLSEAEKLAGDLDNFKVDNEIANFIRSIKRAIDTINNTPSNINDKTYRLTIFNN